MHALIANDASFAQNMNGYGGFFYALKTAAVLLNCMARTEDLASCGLAT